MQKIKKDDVIDYSLDCINEIVTVITHNKVFRIPFDFSLEFFEEDTLKYFKGRDHDVNDGELTTYYFVDKPALLQECLGFDNIHLFVNDWHLSQERVAA